MSERPHRVELAPAAKRQLRGLPPGDSARLRGPILALAIDPHPAGATKLAGTEFWRLRVGDLRVVYAVDQGAKRVVILKVARRSESTYRRLREERAADAWASAATDPAFQAESDDLAAAYAEADAETWPPR